jgi:putative aldouronate transport system permease protein
VDQELYEAAYVDGAGRWKQCLHVTIPGIMPMVLMMLILRMGAIFAVGADKILLLYSPANYEYSDVINTYTYRIGILDSNYGLSAAVGLFNSIVGTTMLVITNKITKKLSGSSLF